MASLIVMGALKLVLSFFGDAITRAVPRAALLGSIAGVALVLLGFLPLIETLRSPVVGFVTFGLLLYVLVAKGKLPVRMPGVLLAFIVGTLLYYGLGAGRVWVRRVSRCPMRRRCISRCRCRPWDSSKACRTPCRTCRCCCRSAC